MKLNSDVTSEVSDSHDKGQGVVNRQITTAVHCVGWSMSCDGNSDAARQCRSDLGQKPLRSCSHQSCWVWSNQTLDLLTCWCRWFGFVLKRRPRLLTQTEQLLSLTGVVSGQLQVNSGTVHYLCKAYPQQSQEALRHLSSGNPSTIPPWWYHSYNM